MGVNRPMQFRFLFLNAEGRQEGASSVEELAGHVLSGRLAEDGLLYDALTKEWAPVRAHPLYPMLRSGAPPEPTAEAEPVGESKPTAGSKPAAGPDLTAESKPDAEPDLTAESKPDTEPEASPTPAPDRARDLASLDIELSVAENLPTAETVDAFIRTREQERVEEAMLDQGSEVELPLVDVAQAFSDRAPTDFRESADAPLERVTSARATAPADDEAAIPGWQPYQSRRRGRESRRWPWARRRSTKWRPRRRLTVPPVVRQGVLLAALMGVGAWGIAEAWSAPLDAATDFTQGAAVVPPDAPPPLARPIREVQEGAFDDMVQGMQLLRTSMSLEQPPADWMSGEYLADAGTFPDVPDYWALYRTFVDSLQVVEEQLFRAGFVQRIHDQGFSGPVLAIRIARGVQDFRSGESRRAEHYRAMRALSAAAVRLHDFLVERSGELIHSPAELGIADDPVLEISYASETIENDLWPRIEQLTAALEAVVGPDPLQGREVTQRILESLARP